MTVKFSYYSEARLAAYIAAFKACGHPEEGQTFGDVVEATIAEVEAACEAGQLEIKIREFERDPDEWQERF